MIPLSLPANTSATTYAQAIVRPDSRTMRTSLADVARRTIADAPPPQYAERDNVRGPSAPLRGDAIVPADSIADMIGVDSHFGYTNTPYATVPAIRSLLLSSGIRHVRDSAASWFRYNSISTNMKWTPEQIAAVRARNPNADYVELCGNELDHPSDPSWPQELQSCVAQQSALVRPWGIPILAPPLGRVGNSTLLGNLSQYVDYSNVHYGVCGENPGTIKLKPLSYAAGMTTQVAPRYFVTEFSYNTYVAGGLPYQTRPCAIPSPIVAAYDVRAAFEWLNLGATRLYYYQLADMPVDTIFGGEGLIDASGNPKPQYEALKNLIALYSDKGAAYTPRQARFMISASPIVHHIVAEKRNGTILVAVYREAPDFDWKRQTLLDVPIEPVQVEIAGYHPIGMHVWRPDGSLASAPAGNAAKLGMYPVVMEFAPG